MASNDGNQPEKSILSKTNDNRKTSIITSNLKNSSFKGTEETEIQAQVHVPEEGRWGWVVVAASFIITFILDGIALTFGSIRPDMSLDLGVSETVTALINSIALGLYLVSGPVVSALINQFGFRACAMAGSISCSFSLFMSYFLHNVGAITFFYGFICGFGFALINMSAGLVVGFYFEKRRAIAIGIYSLGTSVGVMFWYPVNAKLVKLVGWRSVTLFHSGMFGLIYFLAMTFRPLLSFSVSTVDVTKHDSTRTVTFLPKVTSVPPEASDAHKPTKSERLFSAVKSDHFPTAADVVKEDDKSQAPLSQAAAPGPSAGPPGASKLTITPMTPRSGISDRHLRQLQSIISKSSMHDVGKQNLQVLNPNPKPEKVSCWGRLCCRWERHVPESRPMYRDDAFYSGKVELLPEYQKSKGATEEKTGLEYQLAVSRAATTQDLQERRGVCSTAVRRVLATMIDVQLLKLSTFKYFCAGGFLIYLGFLIPFAFIQIRNLKNGIDPNHCSLFVSAMGASNGIGRLSFGLLATKFCPIKLSVIGLCIGGVSTTLSHVSYNLYFQYLYSTLFGLSVACVITLRALMLVKLYGLEKLTNATGMLLLFQGIGSLISTPLASVLNESYGYTVGFIFSGVSLTLGGVMLARMNCIFLNEKSSVPPSALTNPKKPKEPVISMK